MIKDMLPIEYRLRVLRTALFGDRVEAYEFDQETSAMSAENRLKILRNAFCKHCREDRKFDDITGCHEIPPCPYVFHDHSGRCEAQLIEETFDALEQTPQQAAIYIFLNSQEEYGKENRSSWYSGARRWMQLWYPQLHLGEVLMRMKDADWAIKNGSLTLHNYESKTLEANIKAFKTSLAE